MLTFLKVFMGLFTFTKEIFKGKLCKADEFTML